MFKKILENIKNLENSITKVMFKGIRFSFIICLISLLLLAIYNSYPYSHITYQSGLILFRTGLMFAVDFLICAIAIDTIKKQMV